MTRDLDWPGCANVRDLGGLVAADGSVTTVGAVVRADNVAGLTDAGWTEARKFGIRTVLDLRSARERADEPPAPGFKVAAVSIFNDFDRDPDYRRELLRRLDGCDAAEQYRVLYLEALDRNAESFATALALIANAKPGGVLIHCEGGKDRTGVLSALLLRLVGIPSATVAEDYERSEQRLGIKDSAPAGVMDEVIEALEARHGSVEQYFRDAGASATDIARVRERLQS